jgi:hypothetical protein
VKSTEIALEKAAAEVKGSVLASDAFFPFSWGDSVEMACKVRGMRFLLSTKVACLCNCTVEGLLWCVTVLAYCAALLSFWPCDSDRILGR